MSIQIQLQALPELSEWTLNEELNCLSEKSQQSSAEKKDLGEKIVLQHAFSAALEENNKLKEHSWTQVA